MDDYNLKASVALVKCNYIITLYLKVEEDIIKDAYIKTIGCTKNEKLYDYVISLLKDKNIYELDFLTNEYISKNNNVSCNCPILVRKLIDEAINKYNGVK